MSNLFQTDLPIFSLVIDEAQRVSDWNIFLSEGNLSAIKPYREEDGSIWFSLWIDNQLIRRINGKFVVEVNY